MCLLLIGSMETLAKSVTNKRCRCDFCFTQVLLFIKFVICLNIYHRRNFRPPLVLKMSVIGQALGVFG